MDMETNNDEKAATIARGLGIGCGLDFTHPDKGHYYLLGG
jgi:hypothetical protein